MAASSIFIPNPTIWLLKIVPLCKLTRGRKISSVQHSMAAPWGRGFTSHTGEKERDRSQVGKRYGYGEGRAVETDERDGKGDQRAG